MFSRRPGAPRSTPACVACAASSKAHSHTASSIFRNAAPWRASWARKGIHARWCTPTPGSRRLSPTSRAFHAARATSAKAVTCCSTIRASSPVGVPAADDALRRAGRRTGNVDADAPCARARRRSRQSREGDAAAGPAARQTSRDIVSGG